LWIGASENWERVRAAGVADRVFPIHAEAHALPYAEGFFDAAVSLDAYHYFGTDALYLGYFARFVRPGGQIGIVVPGLVEEFGSGLPAHLAPYWSWECWSFHSPAWWRDLWEKTELVDIERADLLPHGWEQWLRWLEICREQGGTAAPEEEEMVRVDTGRNLGFARVVARKR
jgi:SAM-dependent methyltransferase